MRFRAKIVLCVSILLAFAYSLGSTMLIALSFRTATEERKQVAGEGYSMILYTLDAVRSVSSLGFEELADVTLRQMDERELRGWIAIRLMRDEHVVYESDSGDLFSNAEATLGERCLQTLRGQDGSRKLQISGCFLVTDTVYNLDILYDISGPYQMCESMLATFHQVFFCVILVGVCVSWILAYVLSRPLSHLSEAARRITAGDLQSRAPILSRDEIGVLASDFNGMADRMEQQIHELQDAVERQEAFMSSFAHEMKTPMTSIIGYADLLRSGNISEKDLRLAANYIYTEGRRLESLAGKLLELIVAGREDFVRRSVSLSRFMEDIHGALLPPFQRAGLKLIARGEGVATFEPDLIKSLLFNLADNARKASKPGGTVLMEAKEEGEYCRITVRDEGIGIPPESLPRVTEVFYRVDKSRARSLGGAGLGLSLCARIAAIHGGELSIDSRPGEGTCVTVLFPKEVDAS